MESVSRFFDPPPGSFFLFGPRGTGKSTLIRSRFAEALAIDLLDPGLHRTLSARPEHLREIVLGRPGASTVFLDEVQKVPALLEVVHALLEEKRGLRFILTGSSARKLRRGGVDLLGGRALTCSLHPFLAGELGDAFDLTNALEIGLLPVVLDSGCPSATLRAYADLYLREEVLMEGLVRDIGPFSRFLEAMSFSHACPLNVSAVARECQVERRTVDSWVSVLEDLLIAFRLPAFAKRARRAVAVHPKFFFFDAGVYRSLRPRGPLDRPEEIGGHALEGIVAQHLRAWIDLSESDARLFHWRTRSGVEVDFVLYGAGGLCAFEVKHGRRVDPADLRSLRAFREDYPTARIALLFRGDRPLSIDGIPCLPLARFLPRIRPGVWPGNLC
jgi:predicted AAA+ superfamily ATPase